VSSATYIAHKAIPKNTIPKGDIKYDTTKDDTILPFPIQTLKYPFEGPADSNALYLRNPPNISDSIIYDPDTKTYIFTNKVGKYDISTPNAMSFDDFSNYDLNKELKDYWKDKNETTNVTKSKSLIPKIRIGGEAFDKIFGSSTIDIRPQGSAELIFGINAIRRDDPSLDVKQRKTANFDFQEKIQMNVTAKIGDKIQLATNYNTEATFDFENKMKLAYEGKEDEIIKLIEAGDVTLPLNSTLITGSQSLFGLKTKLQFGKTTITSVFSQQKSKTSTINVAGGAQTSIFNLKADQYEENKHFFMAQFFRNRYNDAMKTLPIINSNINITKIEVWETNIGAATTENRNIVAFQDLGEKVPYNHNVHPGITSNQNPYNRVNDLYSHFSDTNSPVRNINAVNAYLSGAPFNFVSGVDYEKVSLARKLLPTEYSFNSKLGFISLNTTINSDQALAVAYQYTIIGDNTVYQVGEFSTDIAGPNALVVKLVKSTSLSTRIPLWNLMMKNVYAIGGYQINKDDFRLDITYTSTQNGVPTGYFTDGNPQVKGIPIIKLLNLDRLDMQLDPQPDGVFDFIDNAATTGGTIQASNGRVYFPVLEPFGKDLRTIFNDNTLANIYCYDSLYTMTKTGAQQYPDKNKFAIQGTFKSSSSSEISLNAMNVPQGSVKVTAGGIQLTENVDYTVDYTLGRVKIINEGILNSGTPISITLESNSLFNIQTKTLLGTHFDHIVNKDFTFGGTILNLTERPLTQKINYGDEPISNTIWGLNGTYTKESTFITKMLDKLPFYSTKTASLLTATGEFADLIPGHSRAIGKSGTSYIDDFEGANSSIDIKNVGTWFLASTPQGQTSSTMFPEGSSNTLSFRFKVARLAWYVIDPLFNTANSTSLLPSYITKNDQSNHYVRAVYEGEIWPNKQSSTGQPTNVAMLNLAFYPTERGAYNYSTTGIDATGKFTQPQTMWGGIQRKIETTDFESTNMEYIEFWMMDPFIDPDGSGPLQPISNGGDLYFDLGDISEDVLRDSRMGFENGLPVSSTVTNVDTTIWGRIPTIQALTYSFANDPASRQYQDVGLEGLGDNDEKSFFDTTYLEKLKNLYGATSAAYLDATLDPSTDDYHYFRGTDLDNTHVGILDRYKKYNGTEGNSPASGTPPPYSQVESYPQQATTIPDGEDINRDNTLSESERYFEYRVQLRPTKMIVGQNDITDMYQADGVHLANGTTADVKWYHFKIPINSPDKVVGNIQDFKSIRFIRMFMKGWTENSILRFATLDFVRGEWRKYNFSLLSPGEYMPTDIINETTFDLSVVSLEQDGSKTPINYVIPPGITREINVGTQNLQQLNEQSLSMKICNLIDGDSRACYKTCDFDMRQFKNIEMFVHAESSGASDALRKGDLTVFMRLGTDFTDNYYEYEIPLTPTPWNTPASEDYAIWPDSNSFNITLSVLENAKLVRDVQMRTPGSGVTLSTPYVAYDHGHKITIVGTPTLSAVEVIMIGVRNPKKTSHTPLDDGLPKCAEIWVDELRMTNFNEKGGWAATSTINLTLADLGTMTLAGKITTPGFGSIDEKINQLEKATTAEYDFATSLELGKLLPPKVKVKIPMHFDYSHIASNPQYDPLDPDILLKDELNTYSNKSQRDSVKALVQDITIRKSLNFVNMQKEKSTKSTKSHIYDFSNFDFTYSYTELYHRDVDVEHDMKKTYKGAIGYNFNNTPKNFIPLSKVKFLSYGPLKLVKDFNFYLLPKTLTFRTEMNRLYEEDKLRNKSRADILIDTTYIKDFTWSRDYGLKFDLTSGLKVDYTATADARIDEPAGRMDSKDPNLAWKRDTIMHNILDFGRATNYDQNLAVNYTIPINKITWFNWVTATAKYTGGYTWVGAPRSETALGNTIENTNTKQLNGNFSFTSLYNKVKYLKNLNSAKTSTPSSTSNVKGNKVVKPTVQTKADSTQNDSVKVNLLKAIFDNSLKFLMGVKTVSFTYSEGNGTQLPGFKDSPVMLGEDWKRNAPGADFVFGGQPDIRSILANRTDTILSKNPMQNNPFATKYTQSFSARATVEPVSKFLIEITATRTFSRNHSEYFKWDTLAQKYTSFTPIETGAYSVSYFTMGTAFSKDNKVTNSNATFEKFKNYRYLIAWRLARQNTDWSPTHTNGPTFVDSITHLVYPVGYGPTSQDVLIPAFLAAYTNRNPNTISLNAFSEKFSWRDIPLPNWKITYDGLTKLDFFKKYFKTFTVAHSYRSTYSVGGYATNILYNDLNGDSFSDIKDSLGKNYIPSMQIGNITISESFNPLISIDMTWNNSLLSNFEIKKTRDLALSFANDQLTEISSSEYILGLGYRIKNVEINIKGLNGGRNKKIKSDMNIKAALSIKTNETILRQIVQNINEISTGQRIITINTSVDYKISDKFTVKFFFDKIITNPFVSSQFPNANTNGGFSLKFTLS